MAIIREKFIAAVLPVLVQTPVLRRLNKLQRSLDVLDIEGLSKLWAELHSLSSEHAAPILGITSPEPSIADWIEFVDRYLSEHTCLDHAHPRITDMRYYLLAYILSATFKDCSIMLRIRDPVSVKDGDLDSLGNSVTVIDLDPKSITRLGKWQKLDQKIAEAYADVGQGMKTCIDGWKNG